MNVTHPRWNGQLARNAKVGTLNGQSETVLWTGSPSQWTIWTTHVKCIALAAVIMAIGVAVCMSLELSTMCIPTAVSAIASALPLVVLFWRRFQVRCTKWVLTTERLTRTVGVFSRRTDNLELYRIQDVCLYRPFPIWIFGYGYIKIVSSDATDREMIVGLVKGPNDIYELLRRHTEAVRRDRGVRGFELA